MNVRIFIESTWKGPAKRDGVAMWLVEYMRGDEPVTRQGFIHLENGTEIRGNLMAMINAFFILKKSCSASVFTQCESILNTVRNCWHIQWKKNGWKNAKGKDVKNKDLWEMLIETSRPHAYSLCSGHHDYSNAMETELKKEEARWKSGKSSGTGSKNPPGRT